MAHEEHYRFFQRVKDRYPDFFVGKKVLDIGSLDINGCNRPLFKECSYIGLDIGPGPNVDIVCLAHLFSAPDESFDVVVSSNAFEHDMHLSMTIKKAVAILKPGGLFFFVCKTTGGGEHGTVRTDTFSSPHTSKLDGWKEYYKNVTENDVRSVIDVDSVFCEYEFGTDEIARDLQFYGIKG